MIEFLAALHSWEGDLSDFLRNKDEKTIKEMVLSALYAERIRAAKICAAAKPAGGRAWTPEQAACFDCLSQVEKMILDGA